MKNTKKANKEELEKTMKIETAQVKSERKEQVLNIHLSKPPVTFASTLICFPAISLLFNARKAAAAALTS